MDTLNSLVLLYYIRLLVIRKKTASMDRNYYKYSFESKRNQNVLSNVNTPRNTDHAQSMKTCYHEPNIDYHKLELNLLMVLELFIYS